MKFFWSLLWAEFRNKPGRLVPGLCAMCVSVALVVWMMGSYDHLISEFDHEADAYMGIYSLSVVPSSDEKNADLNPSVGTGLKKDETVERVDFFRQVQLPIGKDQEGKSFDDFLKERMGIPSQSPILVGTNASDLPYELEEGVWPDMAEESSFVGVLGSASADFFNVKVGDVLKVRNGAYVHDIKVVGIVRQAEAFPDINPSLRQGRGPALSSLFVPYKVLENILGESVSPNLLNIVLKEGVKLITAKEKLSETVLSQGAEFADTGVVQNRLESNRSMMRMKDSAESATGMILFACVFIIFTTLSMGVMERGRKLALLRTLGVSKRQIAGLVFGEALLLGIPAFIFGSLSGFVLLVFNHYEKGSTQFPIPSVSTLAIAFACCLTAALMAAVWPAWKATKTLPLDAFTEGDSFNTPPGKKKVIGMGLAGVFFWSIQPLVLMLPGIESESRKILFTWLGYPGLLLGVILLMPCAVLVVEKTFLPVCSFILRVNPSFLKNQLSVNLLRTSGTAISLSVGLGIYMAVQIWGYSMVVPFLPDKTMPDTLVSILHARLDDSRAEDKKIIQYIEDHGLLPIVVEEPDISPGQLAEPSFRTIKQRSIVLAGVNVDSMMDSDPACLNPLFVDGDKSAALDMMKRGKALLLPDTFANAAGLKAGDSLYLNASGDREGEPQEWKVAGIVHLPGWHWLTKTSGMRVRRGHFVAALAIADEKQVDTFFSPEKNMFFWGDLAETNSNGIELFQSEMMGLLNDRKHVSGINALVKITQNNALIRRVGGMADRTITTMSKLPVIALLIASLALLNTVLASVNARRREYGLMHAVGVTRATLFRVVLTESLMIGFVSVVVSFSFAILSAWGGIQVLKYGYVFGSVTPPLNIPWLHLLYGVLMTMFICLVPLLFIRVKKIRISAIV